MKTWWKHLIIYLYRGPIAINFGRKRQQSHFFLVHGENEHVMNEIFYFAKVYFLR